MNPEYQRILRTYAVPRRAFPPQALEARLGRSCSAFIETAQSADHLARVELADKVPIFVISGGIEKVEGVPRGRGRPQSAVMLEQNVAITIWCDLAKEPQAKRYPAEARDIREVFGFDPPKGARWVVDESGPYLWRVYRPAEATEQRTIERQLTSIAEDFERRATTAPLLACGVLGIAVLTPNQRRLDQLREAASELAVTPPVCVEFVPALNSLADALPPLHG